MMRDYFIGAAVGVVSGAIVMLIIASNLGMKEGQMRAARDGGFTIGTGVLSREYHCAPIVKVKTLKEAKAIIEAHQKRIWSIK